MDEKWPVDVDAPATMLPKAAPPAAPADLDLGDGHTLRWTSWSPDRELNPQYADVPDVEKLGAIVTHTVEGGADCAGSFLFDSEVTRSLWPLRPKWTVDSWEPLSLSPSLLCACGRDHGFIRNGKWIRA